MCSQGSFKNIIQSWVQIIMQSLQSEAGKVSCNYYYYHDYYYYYHQYHHYHHLHYYYYYNVATFNFTDRLRRHVENVCISCCF